MLDYDHPQLIATFRYLFDTEELLHMFIHQCATFVGTVTYMSPERIRSENYSYAADIWSLGLTIFECGTGKYPYTAIDGPANLMLQVRYCSLFLLSTQVELHINL